MAEIIEKKYICDECKRKIQSIYGPLLVYVRSHTEPQCDANLHFCTYDCLAKWASNFCC